MTEAKKTIRLSKVAKEFNIGISTITEFFLKKGYKIESKPNTKISSEIYDILVEEFQLEKKFKEESDKIELNLSDKETLSIKNKENIKEEEEESSIQNTENIPSTDDETIKETKDIDFPTKIKVEDQIDIKPKPPKPEEHKPSPEKKEEIKPTKEEPKIKSMPKIIGKIDLTPIKKKTKTEKIKLKEKSTGKKITEKETEISKKQPEIKKIHKEPIPDLTEETQKETIEGKTKEDIFIKTEIKKLSGPKIIGKMKLPTDNKIVNKKKLVASSSNDINKTHTKKRKRRRINKGIDLDKINKKETIKPTNGSKFTKTKHNKRHIVYELSEEEIQKKIKETLVKLSTKTKSKSAKYRKHKRELVSQQKQEDIEKIEQEKKTIKVTEFVTVNELANMMDTPINEVIASCMDLGIFVSINQRINAETLTIIADEFGYNVEFVSVEVQEAIPEEIDNPKDLIERTPVITVMGHVDHGKTSLLDYIRKTNVIAGEAGGITQHIGAYEVTLKNDRKITFLDTPGHEAFTAMRSRGANITDAVIIVIAADEQTIMPQTIEAINHAKAAGVPIVFAINKIDKTNANPEKVKEGLSNMNILVEDWGGKYQSQEISAKKGTNIDLLLEKILLETDIMELKANPNRKAIGTVLESSLDKGRGYVVKLLVKNGTLKIGDIILAGCCHGKVKAMYNERNIFVKEAGPSIPVLSLGLNGAPQAGDTFNVMTDEQETRSIAYKRLQLQKEQHIRTQKHVTLDEIGRRIAIGNFKELNIIIKGDADGSIEALTDSALKLSNEEIQINIIHKAVGQITESDVLLASASDAIIIGFQVRPSIESRKLAKKEQIDIRLYSVIYTAIDELKSAMQGMLAPKITEKIVSNIEIKEVFKIGKVGTIAGCTVKDGKVNIDDKIHLIRNGIVIYTGKLDSLKRFKDDVKEVKLGLECGLNIKNFNDIKVGDIIEGYKETKVARKL